jgi:ankyrin repeat protein
LVNLLCDRGAHLDCVNALGKTALDIASSSKIAALIRARMQISLKCLCARLIRKSKMPFEERINKSLEKFVAQH